MCAVTDATPCLAGGRLLRPQRNSNIAGMSDTGLVSDGHHTFNELYDHRVTLWIAVCRLTMRDPRDPQYQYREVWRSRLHSDGSQFEGWFILGMTIESGHQISYHLPLARWAECDFARTLARAPTFDGHTPADVLERLKVL